MSPIDFLAVAEELARGTTEAHWRSATSRAYYAAFHHCRLFAEERVGLTGLGTAEDHGVVARAVDQIDHDAADRLRGLRRERNDADYELEGRVPRGRAQLACLTALRLLQLS